MPNSWSEALNSYCYPVDLRKYRRAYKFPGFFNGNILGDRNSTIEFENHYQATASNNIAAYFEVVYWKLYSQPQHRKKATNRIVDFIQGSGITSRQLWDAIQQFLRIPSSPNLDKIRKLLGISTEVLAVPLTLCALADPQEFPMIDNQVADWVNSNASNHNVNRRRKLTLFIKGNTSLRDKDFLNYLNWVAWCQEVTQVLNGFTREKWRARDVEMAVFTAQRNGMVLNVLP